MMRLSEEELEIIKSLLLENGIKCDGKHGDVYIIMQQFLPEGFGKLFLFIDYEIYISGCAYSDISDPSFVEDIKDLVKTCKGFCKNCSRNRVIL